MKRLLLTQRRPSWLRGRGRASRRASSHGAQLAQASSQQLQENHSRFQSISVSPSQNMGGRSPELAGPEEVFNDPIASPVSLTVTARLKVAIDKSCSPNADKSNWRE